VQTAEDIQVVREFVGPTAIKFMAKIEKPQAIKNLHEILEVVDGMMVARGDLGIEMSIAEIPMLQKRIVSASREQAKPVIVATQMLESMISSPIPTRAEASDVANAICDGADAIMLSAETAMGQYPDKAVLIMDEIAQSIEIDPQYQDQMRATAPYVIGHAADDAITVAACAVADDIRASVIVNYTTTGSTALRTARERPAHTILCLTANLAVARQLAISYGVYPVHTSDIDNFDDMVFKACTLSYNHKLSKKSDKIVITAGVPFGTPGRTNILRIAEISDENLR
jgi:pyruvate kinase